MTDEEWAAEQPWQRARRLGVPPVIDGRRVYAKAYGPAYAGTVLEQSEDGRRCCVQWDGHGASWVGTSTLAAEGVVSATKTKAPAVVSPPRDGRVVVRAEDVARAAGRRELADVVDRLLDDVAGDALRVGAVEVWVTVGRR